MALSSREILNYSGHRVIIENGVVTAVDEVEVLPPPPATTSRPVESAPRPRPATTPTTNANRVARWHTTLDQAMAEARREEMVILALFTGSDWCPASMEFASKVENTSTFQNFANENLVLLKIDFLRRRPVPPRGF